MFGYLDFLFLSYGGRIGRLAYWLGTLGLVVLQVAASMLLMRLSGGTLDDLSQRGVAADWNLVKHVLLPQLIIALLFLYPTYALATKRWHDRGKSGWWSLIAFVPVIGGLWMLIELGFLGSDDDNQYGEAAY